MRMAIFLACALWAGAAFGQQALCDYTAEADAADIDGFELLMGDPLNSCEGYSVSFTDFVNAIETTGIDATGIDADGDGTREVRMNSTTLEFDPDDDGTAESSIDGSGNSSFNAVAIGAAPGATPLNVSRDNFGLYALIGSMLFVDSNDTTAASASGFGRVPGGANMSIFQGNGPGTTSTVSIRPGGDGYEFADVIVAARGSADAACAGSGTPYACCSGVGAGSCRFSTARVVGSTTGQAEPVLSVDAGGSGSFDLQVRHEGGLQLSPQGSKPTCNSDSRGTIWLTRSGAGVADSAEICCKDAADAYVWATALGSCA